MSISKIVCWLPRILSLAFVAFISIFALDLFGEYSGLDILLPLFMHLLPSFGMLIVTALAWRYPLSGAPAYTAVAVLYILTFWHRIGPYTLILAIPSLAVALLYFISWRKTATEIQR